MKCIIFDLDGTLWDSSENVALSWTDTAKRIGVDKNFTPELLQSGMGKTMTELADMYFPEFSPQRRMELLQLCMDSENEYIWAHGGVLFENEEQTLSALRARNKLYIVSNCQCGYIEAFLHSKGYSGYFDGHMCWGDTRQPKARTIRALIERESCLDPVYVGDTQGDCDASYEAGVPFIHAAYGFGKISTPERVIAVAESFISLSDIL